MKIKFTLCVLLSFFISETQAKMADQPLRELIVKVKNGKHLPSLKAQVQNLFENVYVIRSTNIDQLEKELKNHDSIIYVERNKRSMKVELPRPETNLPLYKAIGAEFAFNDPYASRVWAFADAAKYGVSVNAAYREYGTTNTSQVVVAVVDTGIDYNHEDLKEVLWKNEKEIPGNGVDDDQNGYVDDIHGINTLKRDASGKATGNVMDTHSHGTHVSGTIGARQNNKVGIAGIASNVKIMGIRTVPNNGDETDVDVAESFIYAAKHGAKIINCSFGKSRNEGGKLIPDTLKYIQEKYGVLVIAAAGNDSDDIDRYPTYPASYPSENLLIVASTASNGRISGFSNYGLVSVDLAAPGSSVFSTTPGNRYESMSGTSMASPTAAGVAAEILSHYPHLTALQLKEVLMKSVTPVETFKTKMVSGGRIDLLKGLEFARTLK